MNPHPNDPKGQAGAAKVPLHLIPTVAMTAESAALKQGAEKYGLNNWRESGVNAMTYVGAMLRHLTAWRDGEDVDPDSGISHLGHIRANCAILLDAAHVGKLVDDRPVHRKQMSHDDMLKALGMTNPDYTDAPKEDIRGTFVNGEYKVWEEPGVPDGLPPLPPVPDGFDRWVYRGTYWDNKKNITYYGYALSRVSTRWVITAKGQPLNACGHYIEAVKDLARYCDRHENGAVPMDLGSWDASHHHGDLNAMVKTGLVEKVPRYMGINALLGGRPGSYRYKITTAGRSILPANASMEAREKQS